VGGVIVRDATGEPTGVFKDAAQELIARAIPRPSEAEMAEALRAALAEAARVGLTTVHSIAVDADSWNGSYTGEIELLRRAERENWLTCRFYEIVPIAHWGKLRDGAVRCDMEEHFVRMGAVKAFADGSLGSATAWMFDPFADDPANRGIPLPLMNPPSKMEALARALTKRTFNSAFTPSATAPFRTFWIFMHAWAGKIRRRTAFASNTPNTCALRTLPAFTNWA